MHVIPSVKKVIKYCKFAGLFFMSASSIANLPACQGSSTEKVGQDYRKYTDS